MNKEKFLSLAALLIVFFFGFTGCSSKEKPKPQIKYVYQTKYIYLPCKKENLFDMEQHKTKPKLKKQKRKAKFYIPAKKLKTYAPKQFITRANKKMDFMVGINKDGSKFIYLEGEFGVNTYKDFLHFVNNVAKGIKEVKINSNGGVVATAMKIGAYIHDHKIDTGVDKEMHCYSACGFVFFAGREKSLQGKARVGLHRPYLPELEDTTQSIRAIKREYIGYWNYIHAPKSVYDEMMEVDRDNLFILDKNNINDYIDVKLQ